MFQTLLKERVYENRFTTESFLLVITLRCCLSCCWHPFLISVTHGFFATAKVHVFLAGFIIHHTFRLITFSGVGETALHFYSFFACNTKKTKYKLPYSKQNLYEVY